MGKPTALNDLPLELLWIIVAHLSPVDLVCLALANRYLLHSVAGTAFKNFSNCRTGAPTDSALIELLSRLSYDLPQYHLCFICLRLHLWKNTKLPSCYSPFSDDRTYAVDFTTDTTNWHLKRCLPVANFPSYALYKFAFVHLQLAMRRFYYGSEFGIPVESLLYTEIKSSPFRSQGPHLLQLPANKMSKRNAEKDVMTTLFSAEFRICSMPPGLCMRTQNIAVVTRQNVPRMWPCKENGPMMVCQHIDSCEKSAFGDILASQITLYCSTTSPKVPVSQGSCDQCSTSWQLEIRTLDETLASLTLTIWMDLGPGLSPEDPKWISRLHSPYFVPLSITVQHEIVDSRLRFERDSVQAKSSNSLSEEEMYWRNVSLLKDKTYKTVMTPVCRGIFMMQGEAAVKPSSSRCIIF